MTDNTITQTGVDDIGHWFKEKNNICQNCEETIPATDKAYLIHRNNNTQTYCRKCAKSVKVAENM